MRYGGHEDHCTNPPEFCDCGFADALGSVYGNTPLSLTLVDDALRLAYGCLTAPQSEDNDWIANQKALPAITKARAAIGKRSEP